MHTTIKALSKLLPRGTDGSVLVTVILSMLLIAACGTTLLNVSFASARMNLRIVNENVQWYREEGIKKLLRTNFTIDNSNDAMLWLQEDWPDFEVTEEDLDLIREFYSEIIEES